MLKRGEAQREDAEGLWHMNSVSAHLLLSISAQLLITAQETELYRSLAFIRWMLGASYVHKGVILGKFRMASGRD